MDCVSLSIFAFTDWLTTISVTPSSSYFSCYIVQQQQTVLNKIFCIKIKWNRLLIILIKSVRLHVTLNDEGRHQSTNYTPAITAIILAVKREHPSLVMFIIHSQFICFNLLIRFINSFISLSNCVKPFLLLLLCHLPLHVAIDLQLFMFWKSASGSENSLLLFIKCKLIDWLIVLDRTKICISIKLTVILNNIILYPPPTPLSLSYKTLCSVNVTPPG